MAIFENEEAFALRAKGWKARYSERGYEQIGVGRIEGRIELMYAVKNTNTTFA